MMEGQVTYDDFAKMGYLYLTPPYPGCVAETIELEVNSDLILDFDHNGRLVGIEFDGKTADLLYGWAGRKHVFEKCFHHDKGHFYRFMIASLPHTVEYVIDQHIVFHFQDDGYKGFVGIDLYNIDDYSESYLVGRLTDGIHLKRELNGG